MVHQDCGGGRRIGIGKKAHYVAVGAGWFAEPVRRFGTFTADLSAMAAWPWSCGVRIVAMKSTGVCWITAFKVLERAGSEVLERAGSEVHMVNPRTTKKQGSGRKSDVMDCLWIRQLMSHNRLCCAFRALDAVGPMRAYLRQHDELVGQRSRAAHHMRKVLAQMNVQLDNVLSDIMGKTGQLTVRALFTGERDGAMLAGFREVRCKADEATTAASEARIDAEVGADLSQFRSAAPFCSWLGAGAPDADQRRPRRTATGARSTRRTAGGWRGWTPPMASRRPPTSWRG